MNSVLSKLNTLLIMVLILPDNANAIGSTNCGEKFYPLNFYDQISYYSLALGFGLIFIATFIDKKKIKTAVLIFSFLPFIAWLYVHFFIDFNKIKRKVFNYDLLAENTLANIAEGQERYKSEQNAYLKDLEQLHAHIAGSHGIDPCVKILSIKTYHDHWTGVARHISSHNKISWDSRGGSSLKKG